MEWTIDFAIFGLFLRNKINGLGRSGHALRPGVLEPVAQWPPNGPIGHPKFCLISRDSSLYLSETMRKNDQLWFIYDWPSEIA